MISLIIDSALFLLVLFLLVPGLMIFAMLARNVIVENRKQSEWEKQRVEKTAG
jgi:hypothetical protein